MKQSSVVFLCALLSSVAGLAQAAGGSYLSASLSRFDPDTTSGGYAGGGMTVGVHDLELDEGERLAVAVGTRLSDQWRAELALGHHVAAPVDARGVGFGGGQRADFSFFTEYSSTQLMLNTYLDLVAPDAEADWRPFVGIGVGAAQNRVDDIGLTNPMGGSTLKGDSTTDVAWQFRVGTGYRLSEGAQLELSLGYMDLGELESGDETLDGSTALDEPFTLDLRGWSFGIGATHSF